MFRSYRFKKRYFCYAGIVLATLVWILMICLGINAQKEIHNKESIGVAESEVPLLLNSGILDIEDAEVSVIVWFEKKDIPLRIWLSRPTQDWKWDYKELEMENGKVSTTLTGQTIVNKSKEASFFAWYAEIIPQIEKAGGKVYLDERTPQAIDISAYLSITDADPTQWVLIDNMISSAAYQKSINTSVVAGQDQINIQLLSRGKGIEGQSVLAIPALIKEF